MSTMSKHSDNIDDFAYLFAEIYGRHFQILMNTYNTCTGFR